MEQKIIVAFGDSVTNGVLGWNSSIDRQNLTWRWLLEKGLREAVHDVRVINAGIPGDRVVHAIKRIEDDVLANRPDDVLIMFGLNDAWLTEIEEIVVPPELFASNLKEMIDRCRLMNARPILLSPNPVTESYSDYPLRKTYQEKGCNWAVQRMVEAIANVAAEKKVDFIDFFNIFNEHSNKLKTLVPDGHRLIAMHLVAFFKNENSHP